MKLVTQLTAYTLKFEYESPLGNRINENVLVAAASSSDAVAHGHACQKKIWQVMGNISVCFNIIETRPIAVRKI